MSRPTGVTVSALLIMLIIVAGIILWYTSPVPANGAMPNNPYLSNTAEQSMFWVDEALEVLVVYFYWNARNWARILVLIASVLSLPFPFALFLMHVHQIHYQWALDLLSTLTVRDKVFSFANALFAIYLLWYLNTRAIRTWFAKRPATTQSPHTLVDPRSYQCTIRTLPK